MCSGGFGLLFAASAFGKMDKLRDWSALVGKIAPRGHPFRKVILYGLPALEATVATVLFLSPFVGMVAATVLLVCLSLGALVLMPKLRGQDCICFGSIARGRFGWRLLARNAALIVSLLVLVWEAKQRPLSPLPFPIALSCIVAGVYTLVLLEFRTFLRSGRSAQVLELDEEALQLRIPRGKSYFS
jgi:hypothetical protein